MHSSFSVEGSHIGFCSNLLIVLLLLFELVSLVLHQTLVQFCFVCHPHYIHPTPQLSFCWIQVLHVSNKLQIHRNKVSVFQIRQVYTFRKNLHLNLYLHLLLYSPYSSSFQHQYPCHWCKYY